MRTLVYRELEQRIQRAAILESLSDADVMPAADVLMKAEVTAQQNQGLRIPVLITVRTFKGPRTFRYTVCSEHVEEA